MKHGLQATKLPKNARQSVQEPGTKFRRALIDHQEAIYGIGKLPLGSGTSLKESRVSSGLARTRSGLGFSSVLPFQ
jgi:hypothetical protein